MGTPGLGSRLHARVGGFPLAMGGRGNITGCNWFWFALCAFGGAGSRDDVPNASDILPPCEKWQRAEPLWQDDSTTT